MSHAFEREPFPRGPLIAAASLIVLSLVLAILGSVAGIGRTATEPGIPVGAHVVRLVDAPGGGLAVLAADGHQIDELAADQSGFARGVMHGLSRARRLAGVPLDAPVRLTRFTDGRLLLDDPATGQRIELEVFGPTNAETFARLWRVAAARS